MLEKMLSEESLREDECIQGAAVPASEKGRRRFHSSQRKLPVSISDVYLLICQELFSVNSEKLLKSKTKSNLAIHKNHYARLHFIPHISANTSHSVSSPPSK